MSELLMLLTIGLPVGAMVALAARRWRETAMRLTPVAALPSLALALSGPTGVRVELPWLVQHTMLELDFVARVFLGFSSALWLAAGWYARAYLAKDANPVRFHVFFLAAMTGNFGLILAADIPTFYIGFALMGFASAGLVFHRGDATAERAGRLYLALAVVGEVLVFTGMIFLVAAGGTTVIHELPAEAYRRTPLLLLLVGFGIKAGALTLHFWLPLAHPAAPVPASAVLSGAMIKAGLLGWLRFLPLGDLAIPLTGYTMITAGVGAAFLGTFVGVAQRNPKTVLAYSSVSQMGIIMVGVGIGAVQPAAWPEILLAVLIYATHHALAKGALFLSVGPLQSAHDRRQVWLARFAVLVPVLALAGAPLTSGALAKTALKSNIAFLPGAWPVWLGILLPLAAAGTTLKMARFLWLTWPRQPAPVAEHARGFWRPWLFMVGAVVVGVWLLPGAVERLPAKLSAEKIWDALWPLLAGAGLAALGWSLRHRLTEDLARWLPAGDMGVWIERGLGRWGGGRTAATKQAHHDGVEAVAGPVWRPWLKRATGRMERMEQGLSSASGAGLALWLVLATLLWLLSGPA